jgi:hypothetical protein
MVFEAYFLFFIMLFQLVTLARPRGVDQCPRKTLGLRFRDKFRQATNKITPVIIRSEYLFTLYPSDDNVMQCTRRIYP